MQEGWRMGSIPNTDPAPAEARIFGRGERGAGGKVAGLELPTDGGNWQGQRIHPEGHRVGKASPGMKGPQKGV